MNENALLQPLTAQPIAEFIQWIDRSDTTARTYTKNLRQFAA